MKRYWTIAAAIVLFFLVAYLVIEWLTIPLLQDPRPLFEGDTPVAAGIGVGLLIVDLVVPVPSSLVMTVLGALFGVWKGTLLSLAGSMGAALAGFAIGRAGGPLLARLVPPEERSRADRLLQRWGALAIVVTRPVPLLAETVIVLAGASPLGWFRALTAAAVGALPPALLYAIAGTTARSSGSFLIVFAVVMLMAGLFWLLGQRLRLRFALGLR